MPQGPGYGAQWSIQGHYLRRRGNVNNHGYDEELQSERNYIAELYRRLDAERARVKDAYAGALASEWDRIVDRDTQIKTLSREMKRLNIADQGLCFGRLDATDGEWLYIGRIGILDDANEFEPLLLDWRAPASRPFYTATAAHPENMVRRRQFLSREREVVEFTDETLGRPSGGERGDAALLAAVNAPRGEGMRDIVATIQSEQDEIIRLAHPGILVIEGGPGTGKTVVALHRVAYLLYTQRERMEQHGVLVVGPNASFLNHISRVLPSLGESNVVFTTTAGLIPGMRPTAEDSPEVARIKGSLKMVKVLTSAIANRQRLPEEPLPIQLGGVALTIDYETAEWARDEARSSGQPHNEARAVFADIIAYVLTERAMGRIGKGWLSRTDKSAWEQMRSQLKEELGANDAYAAALATLWPVVVPETFLAELLGSPDALNAAGADPALFRSEGPWTVSDVALLDELYTLLGPDKPFDDAAERERRQATAHAQAVLDSLVTRSESMEGDGIRIYADELLTAEALAERFIERDTRDLAERASADREWTYRHIVVDEAQELSEMDWRALMRRCPDKSFTIVGDLAQRRSEAGARSWATMFDPYAKGRWVYRSLTVNYRTPAEIMAVASALLSEFAPGTVPPESVRACGVEPWARHVDADELPAAIDEFVAGESAHEGTSIVIGPPGVPGTVPPSETKGLEFDSVLVVNPDRILSDGPRGAAELYVALTRATQRLGVLHEEPLPEVLSGLAPPAASL